MTFIQSIKSADSDATLFALIVILLMYRVISTILTCRKLCNYSQTNSKLSRNVNSDPITVTQHVVQANRQLKHERAGGQNTRKIASKIVQTLSVSLIVFLLSFLLP